MDSHNFMVAALGLCAKWPVAPQSWMYESMCYVWLHFSLLSFFLGLLMCLLFSTLVEVVVHQTLVQTCTCLSVLVCDQVPMHARKGKESKGKVTPSVCNANRCILLVIAN